MGMVERGEWATLPMGGRPELPRLRGVGWTDAEVKEMMDMPIRWPKNSDNADEQDQPQASNPARWGKAAQRPEAPVARKGGETAKAKRETGEDVMPIRWPHHPDDDQA